MCIIILLKLLGVILILEILEYNKKLYNSFIDGNLKASITPHAPYSVSNELMSLIKNEAEEQNSILSIHNQETESENELFEKEQVN